MTVTPAQEQRGDVIALAPSPWEQAARRAEAGEVVHLADDTGEHRFVVMTEAEYAKMQDELEDVAEDRWLAEEVVPKILDARRRRAAGERGTPAAELRAAAEADLGR